MSAPTWEQLTDAERQGILALSDADRAALAGLSDADRDALRRQAPVGEMDQRTREEAIRLFGPSIAVFLNHVELGPIIQRAVQQGWSSAVLQGQLEASEYWRTSQTSERNWFALTAQDPAEAERRRRERRQDLMRAASQLGLTLSPDMLASFTEDSLKYGWDALMINEVLVNALDFDRAQTINQARPGAVAQDIRQWAQSMLITVNDQQLSELTRRVLHGEMDEGAVRALFRSQAQARFAGNEQILDMLDRGFSLEDYFAPMRDMVARTLEIPASSISWDDERWASIVSYADPESGKIRPMTQSEVLRMTRTQPEYEVTQDARDKANDLASTLLTMFGAR